MGTEARAEPGSGYRAVRVLSWHGTNEPAGSPKRR